MSEPQRSTAEEGSADALRVGVGIVTVVAGVAGLLQSASVLFLGSELASPFEAFLPDPGLSVLAVAGLSAAALAGGLLWLRGVHAAIALCSGTWATVAVLAARPALRFQYADGGLPLVEFPARGASAIVMAVFLAAVALAALTHAFSALTRHARAHLDATGGEALAAAFFLVSSLVVAIRFSVDARTVGREAYDRALVPCALATIACAALGLGLRRGSTAARALAIAVFLGIAIGGALPDLFLDRLVVRTPGFWGPVCLALAASLLVPRHHREGAAPSAPAQA